MYSHLVRNSVIHLVSYKATKQWAQLKVFLLNGQIAMVAKQELPLERWNELLSFVDHLCHSQDINERLVCACVNYMRMGTGMEFYIMFTVKL